MKFLSWGKDGGPESSVWGFWFIEIKPLFSIVLLRFRGKSREAFHSHAFHALTWWLTGSVKEHLLGGGFRRWFPSIFPKFTRRSTFHKVEPSPLVTTWALSFRGPWAKNWKEYIPSSRETITFETFRKVVKREVELGA